MPLDAQRLLVIVIVAALMMLISQLFRWLSRRRTEQLAETAQTLGFAFQPQGDSPHIGVWLFNANALVRKTNLLRGGAEGLETLVCDVELLSLGGQSARGRN